MLERISTVYYPSTILRGRYLRGSSLDSAWIVHSGYPLKHRPLRMVLGYYTVDILSSIVLLGQCLDSTQWISSQASSSQDSAWIVHSGYPLKHRPLRIVLGQCTVDIFLSSIVLLGQCLDSAQWISSSQASSSQGSAWIVHSGYHPLKHRPLRMVLGQCTVHIILSSSVLLGQCLDSAQWISSSQASSAQDSDWIVTVDILSSIVLLGQCLYSAQCISSSQTSSSQDSAWIVHIGYHPLKHRPFRIVLGQCTVHIILSSIVLLGQCLDSTQWISSQASSSQDSAWIVHSGYHPLKHRPLRIVLGQYTVDTLSSIVLLGQCLDSTQWISSQASASQDSPGIVHSGYPLKHRPLRIMLGQCTVDILSSIVLLGQCLDSAQWISSSQASSFQDSARIVHSGYHPLKHRPFRIVLGQCTVHIILSSIGYPLCTIQALS